MADPHSGSTYRFVIERVDVCGEQEKKRKRFFSVRVRNPRALTREPIVCSSLSTF